MCIFNKQKQGVDMMSYEKRLLELEQRMTAVEKTQDNVTSSMRTMGGSLQKISEFRGSTDQFIAELKGLINRIGGTLKNIRDRGMNGD